MAEVRGAGRGLNTTRERDCTSNTPLRTVYGVGTRGKEASGRAQRGNGGLWQFGRAAGGVHTRAPRVEVDSESRSVADGHAKRVAFRPLIRLTAAGASLGTPVPTRLDMAPRPSDSLLANRDTRARSPTNSTRRHGAGGASPGTAAALAADVDRGARGWAGGGDGV